MKETVIFGGANPGPQFTASQRRSLDARKSQPGNQQTLATSQNVAVVGAGAAGLAAARELRREGHRVVVFERQSQLGGTWVYSSRVESDPIGLDPNRKIVHSSLYASLRTNLPREVMGFADFPFVPAGAPNRDSRRYPRHEEVLRYLEDFARKFKLNDLVRFDTELKHVGEENGKMRVRSTRQGGNGSEDDEIFDAVVICTGHYTEPRIADIPGIEEWPGTQIHSHSYRLPESYKNLDVVVIGSGASAGDTSREIAAVAKEVHIASISAAKEAFGKKPGFDNMWLHPMIASANGDGTVSFEDGSRVSADVVIHCTGYQYKFPFLRVQDAVTVDDNRVGPLYKHVFPPGLAPRLSFVGVPYKVIGFPLFEVQSRWIAGVLSGRIPLPSAEEMTEDVKAFYSKLDDAGVPKRYTHLMLLHQLEYDGWLSKQCGCAPMEAWRKKMAVASLKLIKDRPNTYRDERDNDEAFMEARRGFIEHHREAVLSSL